MGKIRMAAAALVASVVLAGCLPNGMLDPSQIVTLWYPVEVPKANDYAIVPGERIGIFYVGMTIKDLKGLLGEPDSIDDITMYGVGFVYEWRGLSKEFKLSGYPVFRVYAVSSLEEARVYSVAIFGIRESAEFKSGDPRAVALHGEVARYRTADGFGVDSPLADVVRAYGPIFGPVYKKRVGVFHRIGDRQLSFGFPSQSADSVANAVNVSNQAVLRYLLDQPR